MSTASLGEFELIRRYFAQADTDASVVLGIGDDCALLAPAPDEVMAVSIDTLVEGTHFLPGTDPAHLATRLLGASVSDLAAMGARPAWFTLALTLPDATVEWVEPFARQLIKTAQSLNIRLIGGDTTKGPLALTAQVHGFVPADQALRRRGAHAGDLVCVTGTLGDSRAGLETLLQARAPSDEVVYLQQRFYAPSPRVATGIALRGLASACADISDGVLADLGHLLNETVPGAELYQNQLPLSAELTRFTAPEQARQWALTGGEDFELVFTCPPEHKEALASLPDRVTVIGEMSARPGIRLDGKPVSGTQGYDHFAGR